MSATFAFSTAPYPGLRPFRSEESDIFFGREKQTDQLLDRLARHRFLAVTGPSGCGKSSLVKAGMIPALNAGFMVAAGTRWRITAMRPGDRPLTRLAHALATPEVLGPERSGPSARPFVEAALRRGPLGLVEIVGESDTLRDTNLLVLVDQFEEIFRYREKADPDEADAFVALLLASAAAPSVPIYVVITMRSDYLGDCALFLGLPEVVSDAQYLTPRLARDELGEAIAGPARVFGGQVEPRLVNRLLNDFGTDPDQLPLLQHALMRMWARHAPPGAETPEGLTLTVGDYEAIGGLARALSDHADEALAELDAAQRRIAELMFRRLTERAQGRRDIRSPARVGEVAELAGIAPSEIATEVDAFRRGDRNFVVTPEGPLTPETVLDIGHESLIRQWRTLAVWVEAEAQSAADYRHLQGTARLWQQGQAALWGDPDLAHFLRWKERENPTPAWALRYSSPEDFPLAMRFLAESETAWNAKLAEAEARRERELVQARALAEEQRRRAEEKARSARKLGLVAGALAAVLVLAVGTAALAWSQRGRAERAKADAFTARGRAEEQALLAARQTDEAHRASAEARAARTTADRERARAEQQAQMAASRAVEADSARHEAIRQRGAAERERGRAEQQAQVAKKNAADAEAATADAVQAREVADAERQRAEKHARQSTARAISAAATHELAADPDRSLLLALQAVLLTHHADRAATTEAEDALHRSLEASRAIATLAGHPHQVAAVAFSADGRHVTTAAMDGSVRLWATTSGRLTLDLPGHRDPGRAVALSPDGKRLATTGRDNTVKVWTVGSAREEIPLRGHTGEVEDVAFSPDGKRVATASRDKTAKVWDIQSGREFLSLSAHIDEVSAVAYSPDGRRLATASWNGTVKIWEAASGREERTLTGHTAVVRAVAFSPDGRRLVSASGDGTAKVWDPRSGRELHSLSGHGGEVMAVAFSPDGARVVTANLDGTAKLWDAKSGASELTLAGHTNIIWRIAFSPDGTHIATASRDGTARLWRSVPPDRPAVALRGHGRTVTSVVFSPDGTRLASASRDASAKVWDVAAAREVATLAGHTGSVWRVAFSPDGKRLATASGDKTASVWDAASGHRDLALAGHDGEVSDTAFSRDGRRVVTSSADKTMKVWDAGSGKLVLTVPTPEREVRSFALSPDGRYLATAEGLTATVWEIESGERRHTLRGHANRVTRVVFSPDGKRLATASPDRTARVWDVDSGRNELTLKGHTREVTGVAFGPDGKRLATVSRDRTVKLWDSEWGRQVGSWGGYASDLTDVAFSPDGKRLAAASEDGTVLLHSLDIEHLIALARSRVTRSLSPEECARYLGNSQCPPAIRALAHLAEGRTRAVAGDMAGAVAAFREASRLDPAMVLDAEAEARRLATETLIAEGRALASDGDLEGALATFREAGRWSPGVLADPEGEARRAAARARIARGERWARQGKLDDAVSTYAEAQKLDPGLKISAGAWNALCWWGSLWGAAGQALRACEQAVALEPENPLVRDSRGVARALTGDTRGAIEDFEVFVVRGDLADLKPKRRGWIDALRAGRNPFTREELTALLDE